MSLPSKVVAVTAMVPASPLPQRSARRCLPTACCWLAAAAAAAAADSEMLDCCPYLIRFFLEILHFFSRDFEYVHWNIPASSPIRIFIFGRRYVPNLKTFLLFFKNRRFGGEEPPEGLEITPDILTQKFLEIRILTVTGAGSEQPCSAEPKWTNFSRES